VSEEKQARVKAKSKRLRHAQKSPALGLTRGSNGCLIEIAQGVVLVLTREKQMNWYKVKFIDGDFCRVQANDESQAQDKALDLVKGVEVLSVECEIPMKLEFYSLIYGNRLG
jgi:hypothetical protein